MVSADDRWWSASKDEPAFAAGYTLHELLYEPFAANEEWLGRLREAGVDFDVYFGLPRVYCTKPMAELLNEGATLGDQARALAKWASDSFELVGRVDPGDVELPSKRRQRSRDGGDGYKTQRITEPDRIAGVIRIPRGDTKGLFPFEPGEVELDLRGRRMHCPWIPRFGRHGGEADSGQLRVGREALAHIEPDTRLSIFVEDNLYRVT